MSLAQSQYNVSITVSPVKGGFIVSYPTEVEGVEYPVFVQEIATTSGKAMRIAKAAVEKYSLVAKSKEDEAEAA